MEHILQHDWYPTEADTDFLNEREMDNCCIERILRNKFHDPLLSSDSDDDERANINWIKTLNIKGTKTDDRHYKNYVPGLRGVPPYPKISLLTKQEHYQCLTVLSAENPNILPHITFPKPTRSDYSIFEKVKETYLQEQKEYIEWTKTMWVNHHCVRALRPKPAIEMVYESEFKMKENELKSFPKRFVMAAHIPLENKNNTCTMFHEKDLINVFLADLPKIRTPERINKKFSLIRPCPIPAPCTEHPCWFKLPNEKSMSVLPLLEVHKELAHYALENNAHFIANESALKCLVETDQSWLIPISVCSITGLDGEKTNVLVFGSPFSAMKQPTMVRIHKAFRHLLENAIALPQEKNPFATTEENRKGLDKLSKKMFDMDVSNDRDDDDDHLVINTDDEDTPQSANVAGCSKNYDKLTKNTKKNGDVSAKKTGGHKHTNDNFYSCQCQNATYENPPEKSYRKWCIKPSKGEKINIIVHCSHKLKDGNSEVIVEPIPEYQIELGASKQSDQKIKSLALSLFLRNKASLVTARIEVVSGDVVTIDKVDKDEFTKKHGDFMQNNANYIFESFNQLQGLMPGQYILQHEPSQGANAFLYAPSATGGEDTLELNFDPNEAPLDDAKNAKTPPEIIPILMPLNKYRKILPCAFTPFPGMLPKEPKKMAARQKAPPQAIKWPKRHRNKKNKAIKL